ncbi:MAG TPA: ABC transporter ATP-binding protein [Thermoanaerobaculia bacterium]|nr:ABC transporter ATP-binding protein [Thermoanaerobaculia bacterium]
MAGNGPTIVADHLVKRFGDFVAVDDVTLDVKEGEIFGLLGSNGAGKSTLIRLLLGLLRPTSGKGTVLGLDIVRQAEELRKRIGYMTQRFSLYDELTVRQNLDFFSGVYGLRGKERAERIDWAIRLADLGGKEKLGTRSLPGGWKQRLALACALLHRPRVVFLDEPTGGVDPISRRRFWTLIDELSAEGVTLVVTTHYLDEAERCDRIALMHQGRLVALGTVSDLKEVFAGRAILEVAAPRFLDAQERLDKEPWVLESSLFGDRLHVVVQNADEGRRRIAQTLEAEGNAPVMIERIVPSLEDVFIHSIEQEEAERTARGGTS